MKPSGAALRVQLAPSTGGVTVRLRRTLRVAPNRVCCNALLAAYARARQPQAAKVPSPLGTMRTPRVSSPRVLRWGPLRHSRTAASWVSCPVNLHRGQKFAISSNNIAT